MSKNSAALSASLVAIKGAGAPSPDMEVRGTAPATADRSDKSPAVQSVSEETGEPGSASGAPLNFRVSESFRREFKICAAQQGLKLNELLRRSFEAYRRTNGN